MTFDRLNEIFTSDFNLDTLISTRQSWTSGAKFSRLERPRSSHGLFLLTDYPALYELTDGTQFRANPGDLLLLPKGARYVTTFESPEGKTSAPLMLNFRLSDSQGQEIALGEHPMRLLRDNGSLEPMFSAATQLYIGAFPVLLKAKAYEIFGNIFPIADTDECCIAYIGRHYTDKLSIPALAQRCAMSETAYRKRFHQLTGVAPVQYINGLKIEKACQILQTGDMSPGQISDFLNFYSLPYFYKVFKAHTGMTPNQYQQSQNNKKRMP